MTKYTEGDFTQKVSHEQLAEVFLVHARTLARWMAGDVNVPFTSEIAEREYTIDKAAKLLKMSSEILLNVLRRKDSLVEIDDAAMRVGVSRTALQRNTCWEPCRAFSSSRRVYYSANMLNDAHKMRTKQKKAAA